MNVYQEYIISQLNSTKTPAPITKSEVGTSTTERIKTEQLSNIDVIGSKQNKVFIPVRNCEFAISSNDFPGEFMLLKKFNFPEVGLRFSADESSFWFPKPQPVVQALTLEGYVSRDLKGTLYNYYFNQFRKGLLAVDYKGPDFTINTVSVPDDFDTDIKLMGEAYVTALGVIESAVESAVKAVTGVAINSDQVEDDIKTTSERKEVGFELLCRPLLTFKNCWFSKPIVSSPDPSSNDFVSVNLEVNYISYVDNIDSLK